MPVVETHTRGTSFLSGIAFVAGLSVTFATLAHHVQKKATKHHHHSRPRKSRPSDINRKAPEYPPIPDIPWMTKIEKKVEEDSPVPVAALATAGQEFWDDLEHSTCNAVSSPWSPLTTYEHFLEETDVQKKIAMLAAAGEFVPDMQRRTIMNLVLLGGAAVPVAWLGGGFVYFFIPPSSGGGGGGFVAKDALGDDVTVAGWQKTHAAGDRSLVQGLKGDAHYLIVEKDGSGIRNYALNAVCTHLGCVVPWNRAANKFMCPCHGSQYDETGKVVRGPAPLSLALAHLDENEAGKVSLRPWTETDFRTNTPPWWKA
jgi:cytochrome b6-f complex iron-sulfur subunit